MYVKYEYKILTSHFIWNRLVGSVNRRVGCSLSSEICWIRLVGKYVDMRGVIFAPIPLL